MLAAILLALVGSAAATPAIVWNKGRFSDETIVTEHSSDLVPASKMIGAVSQPSVEDSSSLAAVVFMVGRDEDGSEGLSRLTSSGALPSVTEKHESAASVYYHVDKLESVRTVARDARAAGALATEVTLAELEKALSAKEESLAEVNADGPVSVPKPSKRAREIASANVLITKVPSGDDPLVLDAAVATALSNENVENVVLTAIRSTEEVMRERAETIKANSIANASRRRRLQNNNNNNNNGDYEAIHYVSMTPNILSGILFMFLFFYVTWLGMGCMGMISGQDVYTDKMPSVGREA